MTVFRLFPLVMAAILVGGDFATAQPPEEGERRARRQRGNQEDRGPRAERGRPPRPLLIVALDVNEDGELSAEEIANAVAALKKLDKDGSGSLSVEEYVGRRPERDRPDDERRRGAAERRRPDQERDPDARRRPGQGRPEGRDGAPQRGPGQFIQRIMEADADDDNKLSKDEVPERMLERFDAIDADGDGFLTKEEITEAFNRRLGQRGDRAGNRSGDRGGDRGGDRPRRPQRPK